MGCNMAIKPVGANLFAQTLSQNNVDANLSAHQTVLYREMCE